ncbi:hypothetical protein D3C76_1650510 [compost metagenome]
MTLEKEKPTPTSLFAIGPDRKATKAMGPVVAVASAIMQTELTMSAIRVLSVSTPREVADCSPSSSTVRCLPSRMIIGAQTKTD